MAAVPGSHSRITAVLRSRTGGEESGAEIADMLARGRIRRAPTLAELGVVLGIPGDALFTVLTAHQEHVRKLGVGRAIATRSGR